MPPSDYEPLVVFVNYRLMEEEERTRQANVLVEGIRGGADPRYDQTVAQILHQYDTSRILLARYSGEEPGPFKDGLRFAVKVLAMSYSDHPDFQPEWRVDWPR